MQALTLMIVYVLTTFAVQFLGFLISRLVDYEWPTIGLMTFLILFMGTFGIARHPRYGPDRLALHNASRYLLAFRHRQRQTGSAPSRRHDPAAGPQMRKNARGRLAKGPPDRLQAFTLLPALPKLRALSCGKSNPMIHRHRSTSSV